MDEQEVVRIPIEDSIDLHTFRPNEVKNLLQDYLEEAYEKGFEEVRIIHGKGTGVLRRIVETTLDRHPLAVSYRQADSTSGGWGATIAVLKKKPAGHPAGE